MPIEILMPALSPTMTEGNLAKWLKKEGDEVRSGDVLAEIETDKATMEVEAVDDGKLGKILVPEGAQGIKVNQPIAVLLGDDEDPSALAAMMSQAPVPTPSREEVRAKPEPAAAVPAAAAAATRGNGKDRIFASPLARRMAQQAGLDLAALRGSGPQGRIVKADIEAALAAPGARASRNSPGAIAGGTAGANHRGGGVERACRCPCRQPALYRAAAYRDAAHDRPPPHRSQADDPAYLSDDRLRDRRTSEDARRIKQEIRCV